MLFLLAGGKMFNDSHAFSKNILIHFLFFERKIRHFSRLNQKCVVFFVGRRLFRVKFFLRFPKICLNLS